MKLQWSMLVWAIVFVGGWLLIPRPDWAEAQDAAVNAENASLQVVAYADGRTGFFDPSTRRLYVYGADLRTPITVVEVSTLGQPLRLVQRTGR
jgi:hypothetical protein